MLSPPRQVVIDDSDTQIQYVGAGWFQDEGSQDNVGNFGPTYKKTSHGTRGNDSISFSFIGSSVTVWGTTSLRQVDNGTSFDPKWECFVDEISIGATKPFQFAENNWSLCQQGSMTDGPHVLTINVTTAGNTFWFDYLTFTPSPGDSSATLLVQNTDSAILYDNWWRALGGTANMTTKIGSIMKFDFVGTSLTWVGFIPKELPHNKSTASYSIGSGSSLRFELAGLPPSATTTVYNQVFFTTPELPIGNHTIIVTYEGSNTPLTLDYLLIADAPLPGAANTTAGAHATAPTFPASFTSSPSTASSVPTPSPTPQSSTPVGPIIGGVVGGLATIVILLFALWWWRRSRASHIKSNIGLTGAGNGTSHLQTGKTQITPRAATPSMQRLRAVPFTLPYSITGGGQRSPDVHNQNHVPHALGSTLPDNDGSSATNRSISHTHTNAHSFDNSDVSGYVAGTIDQVRAARKNRRLEPIITPVVHQDSGIRLNSSQNLNIMVEDVPPMYTTV